MSTEALNKLEMTFRVKAQAMADTIKSRIADKKEYLAEGNDTAAQLVRNDIIKFRAMQETYSNAHAEVSFVLEGVLSEEVEG